ncbi:hypothetical protein [Tunturiibacter lichenicola]|uniref:hypothetical protein n=1 Tax=Tunturiibacter lichenicola TaxID=2051959 RepID=UPI003D9BF542
MKTYRCLNMKFLVVAFLTALVAVAPATQAFAQLPGSIPQHGEAENANGAVYLQDTYSEARNGGHLLGVWRGSTNNTVWMSRDNGTPFQIGGSITYVSPTVVPWGPTAFMVFHTGDGGGIFYTVVNQDGSNWGNWYAIPGNYTNLPVSAAQMGTNSYQVYLVYHGLGNDTRVFGTWFSGQNGNWANGATINGGLTNSGPGVSWNHVTNQLVVTAQGLDNQLWITHQTLGASSWPGWTATGASTVDTPHSVACSNGNLIVSILFSNGNPAYAIFDGWANQQSGWSTDTSIGPVPSAVQLSANGNTVNSLYSVNLHVAGQAPLYQAGWKQIYSCP